MVVLLNVTDGYLRDPAVHSGIYERGGRGTTSSVALTFHPSLRSIMGISPHRMQGGGPPRAYHTPLHRPGLHRPSLSLS